MVVGALPVAERLAGRICLLPRFPGMTDSAIVRVAAAVRDTVISRVRS